MSQLAAYESQLPRLLGALRDGVIEPAEASALEGMLRNDPAAMDYFVDYISLWALLERRSAVWADRAALQRIGSIHAAGAHSAAGPATMPWRTVMSLAAALAIATAAWIAFMPGRQQPLAAAAIQPVAEPVAKLLDARGVTWAAGSEQPVVGGEIFPGSLHLSAGTIEMELQNGVHLVVDGPARLALDSPMHCRLDVGRVWAAVPPAAQGFTVAAPDGLSVIDRGTRFELSVASDGAAIVRVIEGAVDVALHGDLATSYRLNATQSVAVPADRAGFESTHARREDPFVRLAPLPMLQGAVAEVRPVRTLRSIRDAGRMALVTERAGVVLAEPIDVAATWTADVSADAQAAARTTIPAGTKVDSYSIVFAPRSRDGGASVEATLSFDRPVLGVIGDLAGLARTDAALGLPGVSSGRGGIEIGDGVSVSDDRRSVHIKLSAGGPAGDHFRLLVQAATAAAADHPSKEQ